MTTVVRTEPVLFVARRTYPKLTVLPDRVPAARYAWSDLLLEGAKSLRTTCSINNITPYSVSSSILCLADMGLQAGTSYVQYSCT